MDINNLIMEYLHAKALAAECRRYNERMGSQVAERTPDFLEREAAQVLDDLVTKIIDVDTHFEAEKITLKRLIENKPDILLSFLVY